MGVFWKGGIFTETDSFDILAFHTDSRGMAQSGSAPALGAGCRGFESLCPDQPIRENSNLKS